MNRRTALASLAACAICPQSVRAAWPNRPVTIVHGFAAGGNADVAARILAEALSRLLGQQFIVEPKPGAGGRLAAAAVARAAPDGSTLVLLPGGHAVSAALYKELPYNPIDSFTMIGMMTDFPFIIVNHADNPIKSISELIDNARKGSNPPLYGTAGNGTGQHMAGALFSTLAKVELKHVPYRGGALALNGLLTRDIDLMIDSPTGLLGQIGNGRLRPLAVTGSERFFGLPNVPTMAESGVTNYEVTSWLGLAAPGALPDELTQKLNAALVAVLADATVVRRIRDVGGTPRPTTPSVFRGRIRADIVKWNMVVEAAKIPRI
jgi:tripartite-type tricarboxylate transporter receptor subunit TctC